MARASREGDLVRAVITYLGARHVMAFRQNTGMAMLPGRGGRPQPVRFGVKGMADVMGVLPGGRAIFVECKTATGRLTADQRWLLDLLAKQGALVVVARTITDVEKALADRLQREEAVR